MGLFQRRQVAQQSDRRIARRYAVDCAARLQLLGGEREGRLRDLSVDGAQLEAVDPPMEGVSGLLTWADQEHFCKVVWVKGSCCGLVFERSIPPSIVERTVEPVEIESGPVANFSNIPLGQKRSRRAAFLSDVPED
ncbi:PilZ domain-containing protein [Qipengyuania proteolytica]|uniref:PilZ domain-containing protein n=1 Tax=Qipengyuania proteolytica TaxID=2867239 RepID=UPI0031EE7D5C